MSPRSREETEQFREERKKQIMDVALELFARKGYYSTSVVQIAQEAGISKGLMYNYFKSREELLQLIMEKGLDMLLTGFDMNKDGKISKEEFEGFIDNSFDIMKSNKEFFKLYISVLMQPEAINLFKKKLEETYSVFIEMVAGYFKKEGGKLPVAEAMLFGALWDGVMLHYLLFPEFPLEKVKSLIKNMYKK